MLDSRAKKFQLSYSITKQNALLVGPVTELFFRLKYSCMNSTVSILIIRHCKVMFWIFFGDYKRILLKNDSLLRILRFPGYFETPLFRTFFDFPWDFEIAGFDCTYLSLLYSYFLSLKLHFLEAKNFDHFCHNCFNHGKSFRLRLLVFF